MKYNYVIVKDGFRIEQENDYYKFKEVKFLYRKNGWTICLIEDLIELLNLVGNG